MASVRRVPAGRTSARAPLTPVASAVIGAVVLGDRLSPAGLLGAGLILAAMARRGATMLRRSPAAPRLRPPPRPRRSPAAERRLADLDQVAVGVAEEGAGPPISDSTGGVRNPAPRATRVRWASRQSGTRIVIEWADASGSAGGAERDRRLVGRRPAAGDQEQPGPERAQHARRPAVLAIDLGAQDVPIERAGPGHVGDDEDVGELHAVERERSGHGRERTLSRCRQSGGSGGVHGRSRLPGRRRPTLRTVHARRPAPPGAGQRRHRGGDVRPAVRLLADVHPRAGRTPAAAPTRCS